jgi:hypothetical protein
MRKGADSGRAAFSKASGIIRQGGQAVELTGQVEGLREIGQRRVADVEEVPGLLAEALDDSVVRFQPAEKSVRISQDMSALAKQPAITFT